MSDLEPIAVGRVTAKLREQATAQREIAKHIHASAPDAGGLIASHIRSARLYELLYAAVTTGQLTDLEARHGA